MSTVCEALDLVAIWDPDSGTFTLRCRRTTREKLSSSECEQYGTREEVDIVEVAAQIASGWEGEGTGGSGVGQTVS